MGALLPDLCLNKVTKAMLTSWYLLVQQTHKKPEVKELLQCL